MFRRTLLTGIAAVAGWACLSPSAFAAPPDTAVTAAEIKALVEKGYSFLKSKQNDDGSLASRFGGPGVTALAVAALVRHGYPADDPVVAKGLKYLESKVQPDGGVYDRGLQTYTTSLAIVAFKEANKEGKYDKVIAAATKYVKALQYGDGVDPRDPKFGGAGYDGKTRPDLSNTQILLDALAAAGLPKDDPAFKRAVAFVGRSQNLPGEFNDLPYAKKMSEDDKGGFVYNHLDADNKDSPKRTAEGGLRSEGGMTYAGLKSFLYAGVGKDDPRVVAALGWIKRHYTLDENPGQGQSGLFYYYQTFAKAMHLLGENRFEDSKGVKHDWRKELVDVLKSKQKADGSWANTNKAFLEDNPELATAFALLALSYAKP
jgi:squalene-hopene/tetraprenyl-beta-curcumene cyclase